MSFTSWTFKMSSLDETRRADPGGKEDSEILPYSELNRPVGCIIYTYRAGDFDGTIVYQ